jgi:hypothetical protein
MTSIARSLIALLFALPGCGGPTELADAGADAPAVDAPAVDAPVSMDGGAPLDAPGADAPISDTPAADDAPSIEDAPSAPDASDDTGVTDDDAGSAPDAGGCEYAALDEVLVRCGGEHTFVRRIGVFPPSAACPDYYVVDGSDVHYGSTDEAIAGESCDASCRWRYGTGVTRFRCGHREGYEVLSSTSPDCPDVYLFPDGFYPSVEAYDASHPCPE